MVGVECAWYPPPPVHVQLPQKKFFVSMVTHLARTLIVMEHVTALAQAKALPAGFYEDR